MAADDNATFEALKKYYRQGIPGRSIHENEADAKVLYQFLRQLGGEELVALGQILPQAHSGHGVSNRTLGKSLLMALRRH